MAVNMLKEKGHLFSCRLRAPLYVVIWFCTRDEVCTSVRSHSTQRHNICRCADPCVSLSCTGLHKLEDPVKDSDLFNQGWYKHGPYFTIGYFYNWLIGEYLFSCLIFVNVVKIHRFFFCWLIKCYLFFVVVKSTARSNPIFDQKSTWAR